MLTVKYKNSRGEVVLSGGGSSPMRLTAIEGLGLAEREYQTASFAGYDGQETVSSKYLARSITISGDVTAINAAEELRRAIDVLCAEGYLYITDGDMSRRIYCNQVAFPDAERILRGKIASFAFQLVCDSPFFEDSEDTSRAIYERVKNITTPFTLPMVFGTTVTGASVTVNSRQGAEPILKIYCKKALESAETVKIVNSTTGKTVTLTHTPQAGETITVDIKNRTAVSSKTGNIISKLTDDTFLSDFKLVYGINELKASVGSISSGITVECIFNNNYAEAIIA